jgi:XTP/dITP diphosphohydrolase
LSSRAILVATRNEGKLKELRLLLEGTELRLETLATHPEAGEVEETGATFEENARLKATYAARVTGLWSIADDSGLEVNALGGAPGVLSARYAGAHGDDAANTARLLRELEGKGDRRARFVCAIALARASSGEIVATARGVCEGMIVDTPRGTGGFGYDPVFVPSLMPWETMAELDRHDKNEVSHRGAALRAFLPMIRAHFAEMAELG